MADETQKILYEVIIQKDPELQKRIAETGNLKKSIDDLKKATKELDKTTAEGNQTAAENEAIIRSMTAEMKAQQKEIDKNIKSRINEQTAIEGASLSLGEMKKQLRELKNISFAGKTEAEIQGIIEQIGTLTNDIGDMQDRMKAADKGEILNNFAGSLQGVIGGVQLLTAGLSALGVESEWAKKLEASTMQLISATQALQSIRDLKDKGVFAATKLQAVEIVQNIKQTVTTWAQTNAEAARATMIGKASAATKVAAAVQLAFNKVLMANPIGLIVTGVAALVAGTVILINVLKKATQAEKDRQITAGIIKKTNDDVQQSTGEMVTKLEFYRKIANDVNQTEKDRQNALKMINKETGGVVKVTDLSTQSLKNMNVQLDFYLQKALQKAKVDSLLKQLAEQQIEVENRRSGAIREEASNWQKFGNLILSGGNAATIAINNITDAAKNNAEAMTEAQNKERILMEQLTKAYQGNSEAIIDNGDKAVKSNNAAAKAVDDRAAKEKALFEQQKANEKEYFDYVTNLQSELTQIIFNEYDIRIGEINAQEEKILDVLERSLMTGLVTQEKYEEKKAEVTKEYAQQRLDTEAEFKLTALEKITSEELARHSENELKKLLITQDYLKKQLEIRKKAGQSTVELEAEISENERAIRQKNLDIALLGENQTLTEVHRLKMEFLAKELEAASGNTEKELELKKAALDEEQAYREAIIAKAQEYATATQNLLTEASNAQAQREANELANYEAAQERKKQLNADRLAKGQMSEREYQANIRTLDEQTAKKKAQLERQAAIRNKALKIFDSIIAVAAEVAANLYNPVLAAMIGIAGAAQIATIAATPLPKAARGRLISGRSHSEGGELIEAERGEAIINAEATSRNLPILDAINRSTGGVPLMTGGFAERQQTQQAQGISVAAMTEAFKQAALQIKPVVSVEQINRVNQDVTVIQGRAKY